MYKLNDIAFSNFGVLPSRGEATNIALTGMLDMPKRLGKAYHNWTGEPGVQPYVLASEIRHGGRQLSFTGLLNGGDRAAAYAMLKSFYAEIAGFDDLVLLETPWGNHQVHISEEIRAEYLQRGWLKLEIKFTEPSPLTPEGGTLSGSENQKPNIDGILLKDWGMFLTSFNDHLNRAKTKEQEYTSYEKQGYQITPAGALEFEANLVAYADSYAALKANIESLHALMAAPGMRSINPAGHTREVFNYQGFKVSNLKVANDFAVCRITLPLMEAVSGGPIEYGALLNSDDSQIVNDLEQLIQVQL